MKVKGFAVALLMLMLITSGLASASQVSVSTGTKFYFSFISGTASQNYDLWFLGTYYTNEGGIGQWTPHFYDYPGDSYIYWVPFNWWQGYDNTEFDLTNEKSYYTDAHYMVMLFKGTDNIGDQVVPVKVFDFTYSDLFNDGSYFIAQLQLESEAKIQNPDVVTYDFTVVDSNGNPVPNAKVYIDLYPEVGTGITDDNVGLYFNLLNKYLAHEVANYNTSTTRLYVVADANGNANLVLPKYISNRFSDTNLPYKMQFQASYTLENGTELTSNVVTYNTADGDYSITLTLNGEVGGGGVTEEYIYISFYYDEELTAPVSLYNYNISVIKAYSPDGLSLPASHTYELENYYTLKIPVDESYPYAVVSLQDDIGTVIFKKGYVMQGGVYSEVLGGQTYLVEIQVYDEASKDYLQNFSVTLKGSITDYTAETTTGSLTIAVLADDYTVEVYDENDNLLYSTTLSVTKNIDITFFVTAGYVGQVTLSFYDSNMKPVNVNEVLQKFKLTITGANNYYVELPNLQTKYSLDEYFMNNMLHYYIYNTPELATWQLAGVVLSVYDKETDELLRSYSLKLTGKEGTFAIVLPIVDIPGAEDQVVYPTTSPTETWEPGETAKKTSREVFDYFIGKGLIFVAVALGVAFEIGGRAGIFIGLALTLGFTWMGLLPTVFGAISSLGFAFALISYTGLPFRSVREGEEE